MAISGIIGKKIFKYYVLIAILKHIIIRINRGVEKR